MNGKRSGIVFIMVMLSGLIIGGFLGELTNKVPGLYWLNYGQQVGLTSPLKLDLVIIKLQLGLTFNFTIAGIIGMAIAIFIYRKLW